MAQVGLFGPADCAVPKLVAKLFSLYFAVVVVPLVGGGGGGHCCSVIFLLTHKFIKNLWVEVSGLISCCLLLLSHIGHMVERGRVELWLNALCWSHEWLNGLLRWLLPW